ncbi:hypothetical protein Pst134EA_021296 [Puccinia striiformis f. sp. tritici]|uniref:hypothetical protein n=1 Tax=Puccinia striiformis f. sp. tritici TaxID=168172 RepID=UPI002008A991|nr:hypothetical protein Pst134EA_021296 [Puccinia striiformis f. sp. tritici]KAH9457420.1 hypothetical protein Pst134EA_021296 [Puccinia striiformis f. sp. tritici]KAI9617698.1 hypothetical protein H4Q26_013003 [Puccinia striiformis f. sp. tritici PST-130]
MISTTSHQQQQPFLKKYDDIGTVVTHQSKTTTTREMINVYNETASQEPFNIDPDLVRILNKNQEIIQRSQPRFVLKKPPSSSTVKEDDSLSLIEIIYRTRLDKLGRLTESENLYFNEFSRLIKLKYTSSCLYLKQRLNFRSFSTINQPDYFSANDDEHKLQDGLDYRVTRNEWPYAIPKDYQHIVVWSRLPLLDPSQARTPEDMDTALKTGLSGFENLTPPMIELLNQSGFSDNPSSSPLSSTRHEEEDQGLDSQIRLFIRNRWPFEHGFVDLMWFLNPVHLQSCPQLPHFHVFVKKL